jgi:1-acyl-sn-glycerol-3-phosphate acyltransferase
MLGAFVAALPVLIRPLLRALLSFRYGFRVDGREHIPRTGAVLVASNHVTWLDGFFVAAVSPRGGKALVNSSYLGLSWVRWLARRAGMVPVPSSGPHGQRGAIAAAQQALDRGECVLLFPEAQITRNGLTGAFHRGLEVILKGRDSVLVVPVFLDNLWGSLFSFSGGHFFRKWPRGLRRRVSVVFGTPLPATVTTFAVRQAVISTGVRAFELREDPSLALETIDSTLPSWRHPYLGLLTVSTSDFDRGDVRQVGQKPGSLGQAAPGVSLRAVDTAGDPRPADVPGRLQALIAGRGPWIDTGQDGCVDRDGFVWVLPHDGSPEPLS